MAKVHRQELVASLAGEQCVGGWKDFKSYTVEAQLDPTGIKRHQSLQSQSTLASVESREERRGEERDLRGWCHNPSER